MTGRNLDDNRDAAAVRHENRINALFAGARLKMRRA
jgi:hypothetical protein